MAGSNEEVGMRGHINWEEWGRDEDYQPARECFNNGRSNIETGDTTSFCIYFLFSLKSSGQVTSAKSPATLEWCLPTVLLYLPGEDSTESRR